MIEKLTFQLGSVWSGEGFKQAAAATKEMNTGMRQGMESASKISQALGGMNNAAGTAANAVTGLLGAISTLNPIAISTAAVTSAASLALQICDKHCERLVARAKELEEQVHKNFMKDLATDATQVAQNIAAITREFAQVTKQANAFASALSGLASADAKGSVLQLKTEQFQAMVDAATEEEKKLVESEYNLRIAVDTRSSSIAAAQASLTAATEAQQRNAEAQAQYAEQLAAAQDAFAKAQETWSVVSQSFAEDSEAYLAAQKELQTATATLTAAQNADSEARAASTVLELARQTAEQNLANVTDEQNLAVAKATEAVNALTEKTWTGTTSLADFVQGAEDAAAAMREANIAELTQQLAKATRTATETRNRLKEAEAAYADAIANYNANFATNKINEGIFGYLSSQTGLKGGSIPVEVVKGVSMQVADQTVNDAIRNGLVTTVKEADRLARESERETRDKMNENSGQLIKEEQRYHELMSRSEKTWSSYDKHFVEIYENITKARTAQKTAVDKTSAELEKVQKEAAATTKAVNGIKAKINQLTLN